MSKALSAFEQAELQEENKRLKQERDELTAQVEVLREGSMSNEEQMRADFEAYASNDGMYPRAIERNANSGYMLMQTHMGWLVWQAATASKQREIDELKARAEKMSKLATPADYMKAANDELTRVNNLLNKQVLELSAQVEVMREALHVIQAMPSPVDPRDTGDRPIFNQWANTTKIAREALSITPSAALLAHENEVAAKVLEEGADRVANFCGCDIPLRKMAAAKRKGEE